MKNSNGNSNVLVQWIINCSIGELLGIGIAGGMAVAINNTVGEPHTTEQKLLVLLLMLIAGALEGTSVAWFQWKVLRQVFPILLFRNWWKWTVAIAILGWAMGMLPSLFFISSVSEPQAEPNRLFIVLSAAAGGALAGSLFGWFQSFELRKHTGRWYWWIVANLLAWSIAMVVIFIGATWPTDTTPVSWIIISAIVSGCLAGLVLGMVTGWFLVNKIIDKTVLLAH